ncbi:MAG: LysM peptidoglycan-binding domain-containing protein [Anaerolineae bacterium]|nr:LysM peptidoglycan-binding domain-containing protein [Anaerolineae bacterium]
MGRAYATQPYAIAAQNGIAYPYVLWVGRTLAIPVAPWVPTPPGPTAVRQFPVSPTPVPGCRAYHTVYYGQTLSGIAAWYGVNVWTLAAANHIYNLNLIYPGQVLCIP